MRYYLVVFLAMLVILSPVVLSKSVRYQSKTGGMFASFTPADFEHAQKLFISKERYGFQPPVRNWWKVSDISKTYVIYHKEIPKTKIYAAEHKKEAQDKELRLDLQERSRIHLARQFQYGKQNEELERCIDKITRNWERHCEDCEKRDIFGFDKEEDAMFRLDLRNRIKIGERIC